MELLRMTTTPPGVRGRLVTVTVPAGVFGLATAAATVGVLAGVLAGTSSELKTVRVDPSVGISLRLGVVGLGVISRALITGAESSDPDNFLGGCTAPAGSRHSSLDSAGGLSGTPRDE